MRLGQNGAKNQLLLLCTDRKSGPRSGGGVVDNTSDYQLRLQYRDRKIDPPLHRSFG